MFASQRRSFPLVAAGASSLLLLAACSSSTTKDATAPGASTTAASSPTSTASSATTVTATETEFHIALSQSSFTPGTYTFKVVNAGKFPHNLAFKGPGITSAASAKVPGGGSGEVTVTLQAGTYELWCAVGTHKDKGMDMTITVA